MASIPEGDDKPYKYPGMYRGVDALVINKIDLLPYINFRMDYFQRGVEVLNPGVITFPISCRTGEGLDAWIDWLLRKRENSKESIKHGKDCAFTSRALCKGSAFDPLFITLPRASNLKGWVKNTSAGVDIEVDGEQELLDTFVKLLRDEAPALSRIDEFTASFGPATGFSSFDILHSEAVRGRLPAHLARCRHL